jgi:opacity protein-like surface antigen
MIKLRMLVSAVTLAAAGVVSVGEVSAADLYGGRGGSIKDDHMPVLMRAPGGPCYMRTDVGYSFSGTPDVSWPVTDAFGNHMGDKVAKVVTGDTWFVEGGFGCGTAQGGNGWRGELIFGYRGERKIDGEPLLWAPPNANVVDPLHTKLTTYTMMMNAYRDLGNFGNFMPYVGAGMGLAYHKMDNVWFTENPFLVNQIEGNSDLAFAWQLMAGVGYRMSDRAVLDVGYRYVDLGKATSGRADTAGFVNPRVVVDDITAHELKIGLRYSLGGDGGHGPLK